MDSLKRLLLNQRLAGRATAIKSYLHGISGSKTVYRVHDESSWSLYWDAHYLNQCLEQCGVRSDVISDYRNLRKQIIHFDSRYAYLLQPEWYLHRSNHAFLTWYHGDPFHEDFKPLFDVLLNRQDALDGITVSTTTGRNNLEKAGIQRDKLHLLPIGVDTTSFKPVTPETRAIIRRDLGISEDSFCIGSFQKDGDGWEDGLNPKLIKGPDVFLDVIGEIHKEHSQLVILLLGPARGYVKSGLDKLGVRYIHRVLDDYLDIPQYYHALDAYLITSRDEGGPKGFMESWASGIPVVSTRMGMPADHIKQGENGLLAGIDDVSQLTAHITKLIETPLFAQQLAKKGFKDSQKLDWMAIAQRYYETLYRPILEQQ